MGRAIGGEVTTTVWTLRRTLGAALAGAAAAALLAVAPASADDIVGRARVVDGDTIEIAGTPIRLWGIDAPESDQLCRNDESELYRCGERSTTALAALFYMIQRPVICTPKGEDQYGRMVATCKVGDPGPDVAHWLVANGHALDWPRYSKGAYDEAQRGAERAGRGMWAGSFVSPWLYRACIREAKTPSFCSDEAK